MVLASLITKAVKAEVKKPYELMQWFIDCADAVVNSGNHVSWITPLGLPVLQDYNQHEKKRIDNMIMGKRVQARVKKYNRVPDKKKQKNSVAPNIIHSLDSSFLWLAVVNAKTHGIDYFSVIHDSFATHAGNTEEFSKLIRKTFVEFFSYDYVYGDLYPRLLSLMNSREEKREDIHNIPIKGDFDLNEILEARHAFS